MIVVKGRGRMYFDDSTIAKVKGVCQAESKNIFKSGLVSDSSGKMANMVSE